MEFVEQFIDKTGALQVEGVVVFDDWEAEKAECVTDLTKCGLKLVRKHIEAGDGKAARDTARNMLYYAKTLMTYNLGSWNKTADPRVLRACARAFEDSRKATNLAHAFNNRRSSSRRSTRATSQPTRRTNHA